MNGKKAGRPTFVSVKRIRQFKPIHHMKEKSIYLHPDVEMLSMQEEMILCVSTGNSDDFHIGYDKPFDGNEYEL